MEQAWQTERHDDPIPIEVGRNGVLTLTGWGIRIHVERGRLLVEESQAGVRYRGRFSRATCGIRRMVIRSTTGLVSLAALAWLDGIGAKVLQLDRSGRVLITSDALGLDDARLRRAQVLAMGTERGAAIVRELLRRKLDGQARVARRLGADGEVEATIAEAKAALTLVVEPTDFLSVEAAAAAAYWSAWRGMEPRWAKKDATHVPEHWRRFDARASKLTGNPRMASDPVNAVANLLAALGETEARWACLAQGLDPGIGLLHRDLRARDSLALDLLEVLRPDYEEWLLDLVERRVLRLTDFIEGSRGQVSIAGPLVAEILETAPIWGTRIAPIVEWMAQSLMAEHGVTMPTRLTQARRSGARARTRRRSPKATVTGLVASSVRRSCRYCGVSIANQRRVCDDCLPDERADGARRYMQAGIAALRSRRGLGLHPGQTADANAKRGRSTSRALKAGKVWERDHPEPLDPQVYWNEVLPRLQEVSANQIARAVGISVRYASQIKKGEQLPHPRLWDELRKLGS